ncbi:katanin p60 ATPase-containing subunit A-like 2 [Calliphora vicina]|uniref:katanin p60 ATPase-containing subunit A-like 2 n=1 Tax=Calliphora vicina TaxID=7373 RepID=UPI00325AD3D3
MSKDEEIRNIHARRKNLLYLMQRYLNDNGFYGTASALKNEAKLSDEYELCDNIDLDGIYLEYASYYQLKFGKYPRVLKKQQQQQPLKLELAAKRKKSKQQTQTQQTPAADVETSQNVKAATFDVNDLQVTVKKMATQLRPEQQQLLAKEKENLTETDTQSLTRLQEIQHGCASSNSDLLLSCQEWQNLAELVKSTIINDDLKLKWSDICGNNKAMETIKEAVLMPLNYPQLFNSGLKPWRSVLLHGPPGSGKTLLAKVLYAETKQKVTFFNITSSIVVSKWRGESEKLLKVLFHVALKHSPSIIFFDEIEGLTSKRDRSADHESSKRFKNELLQLMDGLEQSTMGLFILASTNLPWEIDEAFLRRFEKKLLVQLPNAVERAVLIGKLLPLNVKLNEQQMSSLVNLSEGFTGDEIRLACKEIAMQTVRKIAKVKLKGEVASEEIPVENAFKQVKPLGLNLMQRHLKWQKDHGS